MVEQFFLSSQVKRSVIISNKYGMYELPHELPNDLKVQSCKSYNNKYLIASTQITSNEIFAFIAVLVFKLLSRKVLFINRKDNRNC